MNHRSIALLILLLFLAAPSWISATEPEVTGSLESVDGIRVLRLHGSLEERGFAEGYLCATEIQELMTGFAMKNALVRSPRMWESGVLPRVKQKVQTPPHVRTRLAAVLRGMRARDPKTLELEALGRELTVDDFVGAVSIPDWIGLMCSSFTHWNVVAPGTTGSPPPPARTLVGRNLDYFGTKALTKNLMLVVNAPQGERHGWMSFGYPGLGGCITGISDQGVMVAIHDVLSMGRSGEKITPRLVVLQELLERLTPSDTTAADAAAIVREYSFGVGGNCMLSWRGGGAVLEFDGRKASGGVTVRGPDENPFIACSNHFRSRNSGTPECWRYARLRQGLEDGHPRDLTDAWTLIRSASKRDTLYRLVVDLDEGMVGLERRKTPSGDWHDEVRFNYRELLEDRARPTPSPGKRSRTFYAPLPIE